MSTRRMWIIVLVTVVILVATAGLPGNVAARPLAQSATTTTIPYSGRLNTDIGGPVPDGTYALQFSIYSSDHEGQLLWSETQSKVGVSAGTFAVVLGSQTPIPTDALTGGKTWLEVSVRGPDEQTFTTLSPRQEIATQPTPHSPTALSCDHTHLYEVWNGTSADAGLIVENTGTGDGIRGSSNSPFYDFAGIYGVNFNTGPGVYGRSDGGGVGVAGYSSTYRGVYGSGADGVVGESSTDNYSGVYGLNSAAAGYGMTGRSDNWFGVFAWGNDAYLTDATGDILLQGNYGEIFSLGTYMDLYTNNSMYVDLDNDNNTPFSFFAILAGDDSTLWQVQEPSGNVIATGSQASVVQTTDQGQRLMYAVEGTGVWLEDIGSATLVNGELAIAFDPAYAQAANVTQDYQVFVTATCDQPVMLYVSSKTASGFTVHGVNLDGSSSTCSFDYRVVASRLGYESVRLEQYTQTGKGQP